MGIALCVICCLSLAAFNICSLCLIFVNLINMCLGVLALGLSCLGLFGFLDLDDYFLPHFREVSTINSSNICSWLFFLSSSGITMIQILECLTLFQRSRRLFSFLLILFSFFLSASFILPFYLLPHLSYLLPPLFCWFPPECFFISFIALFIID